MAYPSDIKGQVLKRLEASIKRSFLYKSCYTRAYIQGEHIDRGSMFMIMGRKIFFVLKYHLLLLFLNNKGGEYFSKRTNYTN
jgi:hypothetical protein